MPSSSVKLQCQHPKRFQKSGFYPDDLVPIIQKRGNEQGVDVSGQVSHYAYEQAKLHLLAEDLFDVLSRITRNGLSDALKLEAIGLMNKVKFNEYDK